MIGQLIAFENILLVVYDMFGWVFLFGLIFGFGVGGFFLLLSILFYSALF